MIKKTVTYTDFDGNSQTEDLYFNIAKSEWVETELNGFDLPDGTHMASYGEYLQSMVAKGDAKSMIAAVKDLIGRAYGIRNGPKFDKSKEITADFLASPAYDEFFWSLATDPDTAANFVNGLVPSDILEQAKRVQASVKVDIPVAAPVTTQPLVPQTIQLPATDTPAAVPQAFRPAVPPVRSHGHKGHRPQPETAAIPASTQTEQPY